MVGSLKTMDGWMMDGVVTKIKMQFHIVTCYVLRVACTSIAVEFTDSHDDICSTMPAYCKRIRLVFVQGK